MKWTVHELEGMKETGLSFDETVDVSELRARDPEVREISPARVIGRAVFEKGKVSFLLKITTKMVLPSSKTWEDVHVDFDIESVETFQLDPLAYTEEEEELHDPVNQTVDLLPYVKEAILVEKPIRIVSGDEEPISSGEGWDWVTDDEQNHRIDPRLAKLKKLLDDDKNE